MSGPPPHHGSFRVQAGAAVVSSAMKIQPGRTVAELKELRELTGTEEGAQRVAFTPTWKQARDWLKARLAELPVEVEQDEAGNLWATLEGDDPRALLLGGHLDSVPNGGWLDGCLNVLAGLETLRRISAQYGGRPPFTVKLVDWADEEGARFGMSLFGSSAFSGNLDLERCRTLKDKDGIFLEEALREHGIRLEDASQAAARQENCAAYLELHIEQGPVLENLDLPLGVVLGTYGVERHEIHFRGQAAHSGSTPMDVRRDAFLPAGKMAQEVYDITGRHGGVSTIGFCRTAPGIVTSVVEHCVITLDQRHLEADRLQALLDDARAASERHAENASVSVDWEKLWRIEPILFDDDLIELCDEAVTEVAGVSHRLPSGPLHDAAEVARAGIPTVMMFVQSLKGISHNKIEDTKEEHIEMAVKAFDALAEKTLAWLGERG